MSERSPAKLPAPQRIALQYAGAGREPLLTLFALDAHCAHILRQAREPMLAQMRLAWWREAIEADPSAHPSGDVLLDSLHLWQGEKAALSHMVSAWEYLLGGDPLDEAAISGFALARSSAFAGYCRLIGLARWQDDAALAGRTWALGDLAAHLVSTAERDLTLACADTLAHPRARLPGLLRPLAVLDGLARRSLARGGRPLLEGRTSALVALRLGLTGR